jgi:alkylation response protein AidB-like acyl-CoA dehydrogenase
MDLNYSSEELAFRDEVRAWLGENLPRDLQAKVTEGGELGKDDYLRWHKILASKGWVAPSWPRQWGGTDWDITQRFIFEEECGLAGAPMVVSFGVVMCAQVLLKFGTQEQKQRHLPGIYNGDVFWTQGYSEPGAGADLASIRTRAERHGDKYIVNGQKTWTTLGHFGDWMFCLVRTDPQAKKQDGISFLLIDMKTPGITVRPLVLLDEKHEVNEVFFDNVEVPVENLVFEQDKGWTVAKYLLSFERLNTARVGVSKRMLARLKAFAAQQPDGKGGCLRDNPRLRDRLTRLEVELMALEVTNLRFLDAMRGGRAPGAAVSMLKIRGTEIQQGLTELAMQAAGPMAAPFKPCGADHRDPLDPWLSGLAPRYANTRKVSIYGGSNEIQRNIIAKMTLGL